MKRSKLYVIFFVAITLFFAAVNIFATKLSLDNIKASTNSSVEGIISTWLKSTPI